MARGPAAPSADELAELDALVRSVGRGGGGGAGGGRHWYLWGLLFALIWVGIGDLSMMLVVGWLRLAWLGAEGDQASGEPEKRPRTLSPKMQLRCEQRRNSTDIFIFELFFTR